MTENYTKALANIGDDARFISEQAYGLVVLQFIPFILYFNVIVLVSGVLCSRIRERPYNLLLMNLAISDIFVASVEIPMFAVATIHETQKLILDYKYSCLVWLFSLNVASSSNLLCLLLIFIERLLAIRFPEYYLENVTKELTEYCIIGTWMYVVFIASLPLLGHNNYDYSVKGSEERCSLHTTLPVSYVIYTSFISVWVVLSSCSIMYFYIKASISVRIKRCRERLVVLSESQRQHFAVRMNLTKVTISLMIAFILLYAPFMLLTPLKYVDVVDASYLKSLDMTAQLLIYSNTLINAPIYAIGNRENRKVYCILIQNWPWRWNQEVATYELNQQRRRGTYIFFKELPVDMQDQEFSTSEGDTISKFNSMLSLPKAKQAVSKFEIKNQLDEEYELLEMEKKETELGSWV